MNPPNTIMMDMMFTVLEPVDKNRWLLYSQVLKSLFGIDADETEIERVYTAVRREKEASEGQSKDQLPPGYYRRHWSAINAALLEGLGHHTLATPENGARIYDEVMGNPERYRVSDAMREFLKKGRRQGLTFWLVTNQDRTHVDRLLEAFDLKTAFAGAVVSDEVGFKKPDRRFFQEAVRQVGVTPSEISFIGNNPRNDMEGAAAAGIEHRYLFDPRGEHKDTKADVSFERLNELSELLERRPEIELHAEVQPGQFPRS